MAPEHSWASVGSTSRLGNDVGIRMRGNRCGNSRFPPDQPPQNTQLTRRANSTTHHSQFVNPGVLCIIIDATDQSIDQRRRPIHCLLPFWLNRNCHTVSGGPSMTKLGRSTMIRYLLLGTLTLASNSWAQERAPILEQIAKTYGLDSYGQIEA